MDQLLVFLIILFAVGYLIQHFRTQFLPKRSCGVGCKGCSFKEERKIKRLLD
jgi:hypothetical protein